jgi:phosphate-selective porin
VEAAPAPALVPARSSARSLERSPLAASLAASAIVERGISDQQDNEGYALAARGHYAFFPDPEDRGENSSQVVHLGASARYRNFDNDTFNSEVQYRQRPFFHFTNTRSVDTGTVDDAEGDVWVGPARGEDLSRGER